MFLRCVPLSRSAAVAVHASAAFKQCICCTVNITKGLPPVTPSPTRYGWTDRHRHHRGVSSSSSSSWVAPQQRRHRRLAVGSPHLYYYPTTAAASVTVQQQQAPLSQHHHRHQRRPLVNGKSVAFHVRDLPWTMTGSFVSTSSSSSSFAHGGGTIHPQQTTNNNINSFGTTQWHVNTLRSPPPRPPKRTYKSDLIVFLDLDECLVHTQFSSPQSKVSSAFAVASHYAHQKLRPPNNSHSSSGSSNSSTTRTTPTTVAASTPVAALESFHFPMMDSSSSSPSSSVLAMAHVTIRPGLVEFLRHVSERYETHIFTAALPIYADTVIDTLCAKVRNAAAAADTTTTAADTTTIGQSTSKENSSRSADTMSSLSGHSSQQQQTFSGRWYRHDCQYRPKEKAFAKNLSKLSLFQANPHRLSRAVLVDNNPSSFLSNPENGILVDSFYDSAADTALQTVRALLDGLDETVDDVRPILREQWRQLIQLENQAKTKQQQAASVAAAASSVQVASTSSSFSSDVCISSQRLHQNLTRHMMAV